MNQTVESKNKALVVGCRAAAAMGVERSGDLRRSTRIEQLASKQPSMHSMSARLRSMLAWFGRAPTLPYQTLDTAWAEPPAQRANRKGQQ